MFDIAYTPEAINDLKLLRKADRKRVMDEAEEQLSDEPRKPTRNRKRLRPNQLAEWELRIEALRVFYDVRMAESLVKVVAVGWKVGNTLFVHGEEYKL